MKDRPTWVDSSFSVSAYAADDKRPSNCAHVKDMTDAIMWQADLGVGRTELKARSPLAAVHQAIASVYDSRCQVESTNRGDGDGAMLGASIRSSDTMNILTNGIAIVEYDFDKHMITADTAEVSLAGCKK